MPITRSLLLGVVLHGAMVNLYAYHVEHMGRIINKSSHPLVVAYQICDYKKTVKQRNYQVDCSEEHQVQLRPFHEAGYYFELNMDYFDNTKIDRQNGYQVIHQLLLTRVTVNNHSTRFRTSEGELDDDPQNPLSPWCYIFYGGSAITLNEYGDLRYHCK